MKQKSNRRRFLKTSAVIGAGYWALGGTAPRESRAANERIRFGCVGVNGKGRSDSQEAARHGDVVAICDIDEKSLGLAAATDTMKNAKQYFDFRKMLDEMGKNIDAVTVSTPDHCHAVVASMAMKMGKAAFVQKPLAHSLYEVRHLRDLAKEKGVATEMGNQYTADFESARAAAIIHDGHVGKVKEVHVWTNRPIWDQGVDRPTDTPECPPTVHWNEFIGPAEMRPYNAAYHPFKWRGWWAFGTGALGDMACHTVNMPFHALDMRDPLSVQATTSGHNMETYPAWSIITFQFGERNGRAPLKFMWYDGGKRPQFKEYEEAEAVAMKRAGDKADNLGRTLKSGCFVLGDKGWLLAPGDYAGSGIYMPQEELPKVEFQRSPGHFQEFVNAIKGEGQAMSNFPDYAGPLAETVLLGNLAVWAAAGSQDPGARDEQKAKGVQGKKIEWDAKNLTAKNAPEVAHIIKPEFHNGYHL